MISHLPTFLSYKSYRSESVDTVGVLLSCRICRCRSSAASLDLDAGDGAMLDGNIRCRKHFGEVFGHVGVLGSSFEVTKHLDGKLAGGVDLTLRCGLYLSCHRSGPPWDCGNGRYQYRSLIPLDLAYRSRCRLATAKWLAKRQQCPRVSTFDLVDWSSRERLITTLPLTVVVRVELLLPFSILAVRLNEAIYPSVINRCMHSIRAWNDYSCFRAIVWQAVLWRGSYCGIVT
jgi:hypothetical protein